MNSLLLYLIHHPDILQANQKSNQMTNIDLYKELKQILNTADSYPFNTPGYVADQVRLLVKRIEDKAMLEAVKKVL